LSKKGAREPEEGAPVNMQGITDSKTDSKRARVCGGAREHLCVGGREISKEAEKEKVEVGETKGRAAKKGGGGRNGGRVSLFEESHLMPDVMTYLCIYIHDVQAGMHVCMHTYAGLGGEKVICMYVCIYVCVCVCVCIHIYTCVCVCVCVCVHIYIYVYI
jgi:hypothetical protein